MGIILTNPRPDARGSIAQPAFRMKWGDYFSRSDTLNDEECADFELNLLDCIEAYGPHRGTEYCKLYFQDYKECASHWKTLQRVAEMKMERRKQFAKGLLGLGPQTPLIGHRPRDDGCGSEANYDYDF